MANGALGDHMDHVARAVVVDVNQGPGSVTALRLLMGGKTVGDQVANHVTATNKYAVQVRMNLKS